MEVSSSLLPLQRPSPLHSSSSLSFLPLALPNKTRASSLVAKAEPQDSGDGPSSGGDAAKKPAGFGTAAEPKKKKKNGKGRDTIIRRSPIERPSLLQEEARPSEGEQSVNENAFLLTWSGLGLLILVEGIALAASGFLPDEWDNFFVKYVYPSFTPTVFLFVAGTVVYGVFKYLQGEEMKS